MSALVPATTDQDLAAIAARHGAVFDIENPKSLVAAFAFEPDPDSPDGSTGMLVLHDIDQGGVDLSPADAEQVHAWRDRDRVRRIEAARADLDAAETGARWVDAIAATVEATVTPRKEALEAAIAALRALPAGHTDVDELADDVTRAALDLQIMNARSQRARAAAASYRETVVAPAKARLREAETSTP